MILKSNEKRKEEIKDKTIKLIDSTTISLCLSMFDWAKFRTAKGGLKIHTVWDDSLALPEYVNITEAKVHDSKGLIDRVYSKNDIIVEDRGYFDFALMLQRAKAVETGINEIKLRRVAVYKEDENKVIEIITNQLDWKARTIADLYKKRWDIELFFKAIKQNLQIKTFVGTSENAVRSQIYIALITYLLIELIRRVYCRIPTAFSNFCEKIRICLLHYLTLDYLCNIIKPQTNKVKKKAPNDLFGIDNFQLKMNLAQ